MNWPYCNHATMNEVPNTDGMYACPQCDRRTHERIEANRTDLEALAESDNPAGDIAALLVGEKDA